MKLSFEPNLQYQHDAIKAITGLFEGQPMEDAAREFKLEETGRLDLINGIGNRLMLTEEQLLENLQTIQRNNDLPLSDKLHGLHFSVEMETGTGKTYVYLRSIYELFKQYGFRKYVIVVPSVAIREGVLKNLEITHTHFQNLYDQVPLHFQVYDSTKVSALRSFSTGNNIEVLLINIDSFAKDENIINKANDKLNGQRPVEFLRATHPVVIVDEPQNMETGKRIAAIENLNPLCTLRYSATHKTQYNLVYSLNPVKAYDLGLVKQIEVDSIVEENTGNDAFIAVEAVTAGKTKVTAKVTVWVNDKQGAAKRTLSVKAGDDLYQLSNGRELYANGYIIEEIDAANQCISLSNGNVLYQGDRQGDLTDEVMRFQMRKTIEEHLKKELRLRPSGIKVLSLFFVDKVANYRQYDASGQPVPGKFALWFGEIYKELVSKPAFKSLDSFAVEVVHNGYFSQDKKGKIKDTSGETQADDDTYSLIMKDKEKLLDIDNPLRFIFSHSALREGWDNPNVFQICTLNETKSEIKKRQEIGRGLRLAVDQDGKRIYDKSINRLTVVANESYEDFAKALQQEIEEDCGVQFSGRIKNIKDRKRINYRKGFEADPRFIEIWEKIKAKTTYRVNYSTTELIASAAKAIKEMGTIKAPAIRSTKVRVTMTGEGVGVTYAGDKIESYGGYAWQIPDVLGYIQSKTELTRSTIQEILSKSGRMNELIINPQLFLDLASQAIRRCLYELMIEGIKYHQTGNSEYYSLELFDDKDFEVYLNEFAHRINDPSKTIYEAYMPLDSGVESRFAKDCESSEQVQFYFKLPNWFKIPTPIGNYNPDWAIVFEGDTRVYFVAETKETGTGTVDLQKLSKDEQLKIHCGKAHFSEFADVAYSVVNRVGQLSE